MGHVACNKVMIMIIKYLLIILAMFTGKDRLLWHWQQLNLSSR